MIIIWVVIFCVALAAGWYIGMNKIKKSTKNSQISQNTDKTKTIGKRENDEK